ncbi:SET domain-containing protein-lysine N-methyltransferase [Flaviaesturariibacter flavus]|uniref:SET domain-containing protein-lysine N-methyltransferase n=2 Tax=Flaviaesturariibacter flavus TaxID=2502780 RepID=A0A4R1BJH6_9BACT|nr:SET domain-containing protein-lysine N-methyltransferase [Flaviaesturariibacter flavus]
MRQKYSRAANRHSPCKKIIPNICRVNPINYLHPALRVSETESRGRGMFTDMAMKPHTLVEVAPVIVLPARQRRHIDETLLHDYIFEWGKSRTQCCMALGYVSLYNHAYDANCEYEMHYPEQLILIRTVRAVKKGEELFINYNGVPDDASPLWFEAH